MISIKEVQIIAASSNYEFYYNRSLKIWALYPIDLSKEASYHTKQSLRLTDISKFIELYFED